MAQETCSSSSSSSQTWSYEVFVSFYGKDTRLSFTDHLFAALDRSGIDAFRDNRDIEIGEAIWPELEKAIESSRIAIIVFSRNYAASRWCLDELAKIMECKKNLKQIVMPVFYHVDPSDVRNQKGSLKIAFAGHEERFEKGKVERWRNILTEVANLSGEDLQNVANRFESNFIEKIIDDIFYKLNEHSMVVAPNPVGIESRVQYLYKLLSRGSSDVYMVGIWGIGGIGKTTIAKALYNLLQRKFKASCFLENIGEAAKQPNGLIDLQDQLLSSVHVNNNRKIKLVDQGTMDIQKRAWSKRVLVVFDDVDHWDQLDKLAIKRGCFQPGSVIIITTRNKSMLKLDDIDVIYTPPILDNQESIKLLSRYAFDKDRPKKNYEKLSKEVINYAQGLPLTLKVLGSLLSDKSTTEWEGTLEQLRAIPFGEIQEKLMVSFYSLSDTQKDLFLDIACFFVGMEKNHAFKIIHDSNLILESELGVLVRQCLVTIDCSNRLKMHDIIRDMGREVVRRKSPKVPRDRSRLWNHTDVVDALGHHKGGEEVEGIMIDLSGVHDNLEVDAKAFANMHQLRVLQLNYARLKGNFQCPSKRLRYLEWYGFPMKSIPADIYMENLVALYMPYSSLRELWTGNKILKKLKFLDVNHSYHLRRTPDFSGNTNLEVLVFNNCTSLVYVHKSVTCLDKLVTLDLEDCKKLRELPLGIHNIKARVNVAGIPDSNMNGLYKSFKDLTLSSRLKSLELPLNKLGYSSLIFSKALKDFTFGYSIILKSAGTHLSSYPQPGLEERAAFAGDDNFGQQKTENFQWKQRRLQSVNELLLDSQDADIWTSLGSIFGGSNWNLFEKGIIALHICSVFLPGGEFPDWFDYESTGSILSFVVPPRKKQMIRGWFFCVVFASRFHEINGFTLLYELKNITKNITWHYRQQDCRVVPCQEHMWLHSVPLNHAMADLLEAGDEVEYSIQFIGSCRPKIFGVNLIYENDKKEFQYFFEAMIQNAYLHEDVYG
ncbi:disease resistance protein RPV1-like isoform X1 [Castanea sativa]|uniref:disease resistance protein RPV1-like isoform X1 n=1 Tax=Castanea sativa TaxID=21020 RepID=UPI003F654158